MITLYDTVHFIGIGGIGMSAIAEVMYRKGYTLQGSDIVENDNTRRLCALGIPVYIGHHPDNLGQSSQVVISSAIDMHCPERLAAQQRGLPIIHRTAMLAVLMENKKSISVSGTHGKTTTTSLLATLFENAGLDPTVINGGIIEQYATNAKLGTSDWMIVEADESDASLLLLPSTFVVVTNINPEHLTHYSTFDELKKTFYQFIQNIPDEGCAILCQDHPEVRTLRLTLDRQVISYGIHVSADISAENITFGPQGTYFDAVIYRPYKRCIKNLCLPLLGCHNLQNALAMIAMGSYLDFPNETISKTLRQFSGVRRRFTYIGETKGILVVDDYGHHPIEIQAVLQAARLTKRNRTLAVFQPHRYTRLAHLFEEFCVCFDNADEVIIADVYAAGEPPIDGYNRDALVQGLQKHGHPCVIPLQDPADLVSLICERAKYNDIVVCLGAGSITSWAKALPQQIEQQYTFR